MTTIGETARPTRFFEVDCANCGDTFITPSSITAFCSTDCQGEADAVRKIRREIANNLDSPEQAPDSVIRNVRVKVHWALRGGYSRPITNRLRKEVWERDHGLCTECGKPGAEIDHILLPLSDPRRGTADELRLVCKSCHDDITDLNHGDA